MEEYIVIILAAIIVIFLAKFLGASAKLLIKIIVNIVVGFVILFVVNTFLGEYVTIPQNVITSLVVGVFGVPGVILLLILSYFKII